jgi:hypothetical protein
MKRKATSNGDEHKDGDGDQVANHDPLTQWGVILPKLKDALIETIEISNVPCTLLGDHIQEFLTDCYDEFRLSIPCFVCALIYIIDLNKKVVRTTYRNMKTHFLVALLIASKYNDDLIYSNATYADVSKLRQSSINRCEVQFLKAFHFDMTVTRDRFVDTLTSIGCLGCYVSQFL